MAKYAKTATKKTPLRTSEEQTYTHEGAPGLAKDAKTELFTMAVTSMTAEKTFYEDAKTRDSRLQELVHQITSEDPEFIQKLVPYLRKVANMRSAPLVIAAEYALAGGPGKRGVVNSAMLRADEPAEFVGYWMGRTGGKTFPGGVQRGLADAVQALYNEYAVLKYDSSRNSVRMGDVLNLVHPEPRNQRQGSLFQWILDKRHHGDVWMDTEELPVIHDRDYLQAIPVEERRAYLRGDEYPEVARTAGITWEFLSGWLPGGMDAEAWEKVIPQMGYMALLRNLRNFDEAGISDGARKFIKGVLADPDRVAKSRQFPFRFWSAWNATQSLHWGETLEAALNLSVENVPELDGSTLVLVDVSASMTGPRLSGRSTVSPSDIAALFGAVMFEKNYGNARVAVFGTGSKDVTPKARGSILRNMEVFRRNNGVGHGTNISGAVMDQYNEESRVVLFTDMQAHDGGVKKVANRAKVHYFDLGGYRTVPEGVGDNGVFMYAGFTDSTFRQMPLYERVGRGDWEDLLDG